MNLQEQFHWQKMLAEALSDGQYELYEYDQAENHRRKLYSRRKLSRYFDEKKDLLVIE